ncbi:MAG: hypothetical protein ACREBU_09355 [Nitrososphaera sp.]
MSDIRDEWSSIPTDLGGWANRAMQQLRRADKAEAEVERWKTYFEQEKEAFAAEHVEVERLQTIIDQKNDTIKVEQITKLRRQIAPGEERKHERQANCRNNRHLSRPT